MIVGLHHLGWGQSVSISVLFHSVNGQMALILFFSVLKLCFSTSGFTLKASDL